MRRSASPRRGIVSGTPRGLRDGDRHALNAVVGVAADVPVGALRLRVAGGVVGAAGEDVLAGCRVPLGAPAAPGPASPRRVELGVAPRAVDGELDSLDLGPAGPGATLDARRAGGERPLALGEAGDAGRDHQGA